MGRRTWKKDTQAKVERIGSMDFLRRRSRRREEVHGKQYLRTLGHPSFSCWKISHLDKDSCGVHDETDLRKRFPWYLTMTVSSISCEFEGEKKIVPRRAKFNTKTHKQKKEARNKSKPAPKSVSMGGQVLHPLIQVGDDDDHPGLHAVSDSSRWMSVCPTTGFNRTKSVLDSGASDRCAPDCMCPEVMSRPFNGSSRGQMFTAAGGKKIANEGEKDCSDKLANG